MGESPPLVLPPPTPLSPLCLSGSSVCHTSVPRDPPTLLLLSPSRSSHPPRPVSPTCSHCESSRHLPFNSPSPFPPLPRGHRRPYLPLPRVSGLPPSSLLYPKGPFVSPKKQWSPLPPSFCSFPRWCHLPGSSLACDCPSPDSPNLGVHLLPGPLEWLVCLHTYS